MMLDDANKVVGAACVAIRGPVLTVPAAALWALRMLLRHCGVSVDVASDCAFVVNGFNGARGRERTLWPTHAGAWRMVWQHVDDTVHGHVVVRKVTAHATRTDVRLWRVTERDRIGNEAADHFTKLGANLHPHCASFDSRAKRAAEVLSKAAKWVAKMGITLGAGGCRRDSKPLPMHRRRRAALSEHRPKRRASVHELVRHEDGFECRICSDRRTKASAFSRQCIPLAAWTLPVAAHKLMQSGPASCAQSAAATPAKWFVACVKDAQGFRRLPASAE